MGQHRKIIDTDDPFLLGVGRETPKNGKVVDKKQKQPQQVADDPFLIGLKKKEVAGSQPSGEPSEATTQSISRFQLPSSFGEAEHQDIESLNKEFEEFTGHKKFSLSEPVKPKNLLSQDRYLKQKKEFERSKYRDYQGGKAAIANAAREIHFGEISEAEIKRLQKNPQTQNIINKVIQQFVPEATNENVTTEEIVKKAAFNIQAENSINAVNFHKEQVQDSKQRIADAIPSMVIKSPIKENVYTAGAGTLKTEVVGTDKLPQIDFSSKESVGKAIKFMDDNRFVTEGSYLQGADGKKSDYSVEDLYVDLTNVYSDLVQKGGLDEDVKRATPYIQKAIASNKKQTELGEAPPSGDPQTDARTLHLQQGLNYMKNIDPVRYTNTIRALYEEGKLSDDDYKTLSIIGQDITNKNIFTAGAYNPEAIGKETSIDYTTHQDKKAEYARAIGEWLKDNGYKNYRYFNSEAIKKAAAALGLPNQSIIKELVMDEKKWFYDAIPKSGGVEAIARGVMQPLMGMKSTFDKWFNESPAQSYLRAKALDTGSAQKVANEKGELSNELPSDRSNIWYDVLEGTGQFLPQILLTKGFGAPLAGISKGAALYGGTLLSTYIQTYGDAYSEALLKTGDPDTAKIMGGIDATVSSLAEAILPDAKLAERIFSPVKREFVNDLVGLIKKGGSIAELSKKAQPLIKRLVKGMAEFADVERQEISEEVLTQWGNYINNAIFSPATAKDRNVKQETIDTIVATGLSMIVPAILGGGGAALNKEFTVSGLHSATLNYDDSKKALSVALNDKEISQQQYNDGIKLLNTHQQSLFNAPTATEAGFPLDEKQRKEYAYQDTIAKIYRDKAKNAEGVTKSYWENKAKEAENVQKEIINPSIITDEEKSAKQTEGVSKEGSSSETKKEDAEKAGVLTPKEGAAETAPSLRTPEQVDKLLSQDMTPEQKYAPVDIIDPVTGKNMTQRTNDTQPVTARTVVERMKIRYDTLTQLIKCIK